MNKSLLFACMALLLAACGKETGEQDAEENTKPLLAHVPADTIYAFATLAPVPRLPLWLRSAR